MSLNNTKGSLGAFKPTQQEMLEKERQNSTMKEISNQESLMQIQVQAKIVKSSNNRVMGLIEDMSDKKPKFNNLILIVMIINTITNALVGFQAAYQYPEMKFQCLENGIWESCKSKIACDLSKDLWRKDPDQLHTYTWEYDLACDDAYKRDYALFSFWCVGGTLNLVMMQFVDFIGRKKAQIISTAVSLICMIITYFCHDFIFKVSLMAISFGMSDNVFTLMFIYMSEILTEKYRLPSNSIIMSAFAFGEVMLAVSMYVLNTYGSIEQLISIFSAISLVSLFFIPESPIFLASKKKYGELKNVLKFMNSTIYSKKDINVIEQSTRAIVPKIKNFNNNKKLHTVVSDNDLYWDSEKEVTQRAENLPNFGSIAEKDDNQNAGNGNFVDIVKSDICMNNEDLRRSRTDRPKFAPYDRDQSRERTTDRVHPESKTGFNSKVDTNKGDFSLGNIHDHNHTATLVLNLDNEIKNEHSYWNNKIEVLINEISESDKLTDQIVRSRKNSILQNSTKKSVKANQEDNEETQLLKANEETHDKDITNLEREESLLEKESITLNLRKTEMILEEELTGNHKIPAIKHDQKKMPAIAIIFCNAKYFLYVLGFMLILGNTYLVYQSSIVDTSSLGLPSIQISGIALGGVELLQYLICFPFATKMKRRQTTVICCTVIVLGAVTILVLDQMATEESRYNQTIGWLAVIACKGPASIMYTYINNYMAETFPTEIRGAGAGLVTAIARYIGASSALIKSYTKGSGIDLIVPCSVLSILVIPVAFFMPETLNKQIE